LDSSRVFSDFVFFFKIKKIAKREILKKKKKKKH